MKKFLLMLILFVVSIAVPLPTMAGVYVSVGVSLPPPIVFEEPPEVIVLPDTNDVYVVPTIETDMFFWNGWWWRPWEGGWYRARFYNRGWIYFNRVPRFYYDVDPGWRGYYRDHDWRGHPWNYERIHDRDLRRNWRTWHNNGYWERQKAWGVRDYHPQTIHQRQELRYQRQREYQRRPDVQRHQQQMRQQKRHPQGKRYQHPQQR